MVLDHPDGPEIMAIQWNVSAYV